MTWIRRWGPALLLMAVIFGLSAQPRASLPDFASWDLLVKKGGHMFGYALLGAAYLRGLAGSRPTAPRWRLAAVAVALAAIYGASDEFHQSFVPGRGATVVDVLIDTLGAALGVAGSLAWLQRRAGQADAR
jgi:VanZ family protein